MPCRGCTLHGMQCTLPPCWPCWRLPSCGGAPLARAESPVQVPHHANSGFGGVVMDGSGRILLGFCGDTAQTSCLEAPCVARFVTWSPAPWSMPHVLTDMVILHPMRSRGKCAARAGLHYVPSPSPTPTPSPSLAPSPGSGPELPTLRAWGPELRCGPGQDFNLYFQDSLLNAAPEAPLRPLPQSRMSLPQSRMSIHAPPRRPEALACPLASPWHSSWGLRPLYRRL